MTFFLANWRTILPILLVVTNAITFQLWRSSVNSLDEYKANVTAIAKAQEEKTKRIVSEQQKITEETTNGWKAALDSVRASYRLRIKPSSSDMPGISKATTGIDAIPADALPVAEQCAETTLQLISLQEWLRKQEYVK